MDLSIVSGTYNRLGYLKKMIQSGRESLAGLHGLEYEFVIVDGGSEDGTLAWLRGQPDVHLIEHGKLLGAVRAFNDGARAAQGQFVVLANDDVEFLGDGLAWAWSFMEQRPEVGMGCFYQDRGKRGWHVELMPCVRDGRQVHLPYGQVCILPKTLGDRLGWWGDYLHTYGGDNELSSNVYESGYRVAPLYRGQGEPETIPRLELGCCIHDSEPADALRQINNISGGHDPRAVLGHHPDSWKWGRRWRHGKTVGPVVQSSPRFALPRPEPRERVVYLPIYEQGWAVQKQQKRGLREALARVAVVAEYDYVGRVAAIGKNGALDEIRSLLQWVHPTTCLFQFHGPDPFGPSDVAGLRRYAPGAWFVNWNGDYWPENLLSEGGVALARSFDLMTSVNRAAIAQLQAQGVNAAYWQIGWEPDGVGHEPQPEDRCDVVFLANGYSAARRALVKSLRGLPHSLRLWGNGWPEGWAVGQCTYDFITACRAYRGAKFSIGDSQWPESGFVSNRVMQALAAGGSVLCHQWFSGMEELGLVDGETCLVWRDVSDLKRKLVRGMDDEPARRRIADAGERLARERHSFSRRVEELWTMRPGLMEEDWR